MKGWNRLLWGVAFTGARKNNEPLLIGQHWDSVTLLRPAAYAGEPTHALLFYTRQQARAWCAAEHAQYAGRTDCCAKWRFRPVRVREIVKAVSVHP